MLLALTATAETTVLRAQRMIDVVLRSTGNARKTLLAGVTTVRELGQLRPTNELLAVSMAKSSVAAWIDAPRIVAAGHAISITGGHIDPEMSAPVAAGLSQLGSEQGVADGVDEAVKAVRWQIKRGAQVIKIAATAPKSKPSSTKQRATA